MSNNKGRGTTTLGGPQQQQPQKQQQVPLVGSGIDNGAVQSGAAAAVRTGIPTWIMLFLVLATLAGVLAIIGLTVQYDKDDQDAYVCTGGDQSNWGCSYIFYPEDPECAVIPYAPAAGAGEDDFCYFGQCTYMKPWMPMDPYPCMFNTTSSDNAWPTIGVESCVDMVSPDYDRKDRLEAHIFCAAEGFPICIFKDKCAYFILVSDSKKRAEQEGVSLESLALPSKEVYDEGWKRNVENLKFLTTDSKGAARYASTFYKNALSKNDIKGPNVPSYGTVLEQSDDVATENERRSPAAKKNPSPSSSSSSRGAKKKAPPAAGNRFGLSASSAPSAPPEGGLPLFLNITSNQTIIQYMAARVMNNCRSDTVCLALYPQLSLSIG